MCSLSVLKLKQCLRLPFLMHVYTFTAASFLHRSYHRQNKKATTTTINKHKYFALLSETVESEAKLHFFSLLFRNVLWKKVSLQTNVKDFLITLLLIKPYFSFRLLYLGFWYSFGCSFSCDNPSFRKITHGLKCPVLCFADTSNQLCIHSPWAKWQHQVWLLL